MQQVTFADWQTVHSKGGKLTFRPLGGNRVRCNQLPHLGRLTRNQAKSVCSAIASMDIPEGCWQKEKQPKKPPEPTLLDALVRGDFATCPHCKESTHVGINLGRRKCDWCHRPFNAISYISYRPA